MLRSARPSYFGFKSMAKNTTPKYQDQQGLAASPANGHGSSAGPSGDGRAPSISNEEIALRAYEIYEREGRSDGHDMDHWLQAESELRTEHQGRGSQTGSQSGSDLPRSARLRQAGQVA